jgi:hypothetical protein
MFNMIYRGCAIALSAALAVAPAMAETNAGKVSPKGSALPQTIITQAYMAAVIDQGAVVLHQKGLKSVTSPSTGIFCLTPSDKTLKTKSTFPIVTIEWGDSLGSSLLAYYEYLAEDCPHPSSQYEVRTYDFSSGTPTLTTLVAFVIVVD